MADNVKISELDALTAAQNGTVVPVVDGGTTKKMSLSTLQTHLTASFATPSQLSSEVSTLNSTIDGLTTDDIAEGTNLYYTNARVTTHIEDLGALTSSQMVDALQIQNLNSAVLGALGGSDIISGSITTSSIQDFPTEVSRSAAAAGFGAGGGGATGDIEGVTAGDGISGGGVSGTVTVSLDTGSTHFTTGVSASAAAAGFGASGGGGSTDYISNITLSNSTLTFTGQGSAFNNSINLAVGGGDGGNLLTTDDAGNFVGLATYETDSGSFASRIDSIGGGGSSVPAGTVSSSAQVIDNLGGSGVVSSSAQIVAANTDLSTLTIDDIGNGTINKYYSDSLVLSYINSIQVVSGSGGGGFDVAGTDIVSSSTQIANLGFVESSTFGTATESLQLQINGIEGISANDQNTFLATQFFEQDIIVTGSIRIESGSGFFSGSGEKLYNIPASAIVGSVPSSTTELTDGTNTLAVDYSTGILATIETGSFVISGSNLILRSGSFFSGSGEGLFNIPGSAIVGGVGGSGTSIASGSITASIEENGLVINSGISASGEITAQSISVGTSGTPTIYSNNNLNLSASNAVVITDSPLRLNPFTNTETGSFSISDGDLVYSSTSNDFYGYKNGSWVSLTGGASDGVNWGQIVGIPNDLVSSSAQLGDLGAITSSAQLLPTGSTAGDVLFIDTLGGISSSADLQYTSATQTLTAPTMSVGTLSYSTLSGPAAATGSFNLVDTDRLLINNAIEFPTSDGTVNQVLKTDGAGNIGFATLETLVSTGDITTTGTITMGTGSVDDNLTVGGTINSQTISTGNTVIESANIRLQSGGQLLLSSSNESLGVVIDDVLVLPERADLPATPRTGSIIVSGSSSGPRPYFFDGTAWTRMFT